MEQHSARFSNFHRLFPVCLKCKEMACTACHRHRQIRLLRKSAVDITMTQEVGGLTGRLILAISRRAHRQPSKADPNVSDSGPYRFAAVFRLLRDDSA